MRTAVIILAAGTSSRMHQPKQLLKVGSETLLEIALKKALQSRADEVFCVLGSHFSEIKKSIGHLEVQIIENKNFKTGLSSSIVSGILQIIPLHFEAVLIMLGDQPKISVEYLNLLIKNFEDDPTFITASDYGNRNGVPAIFPKKYFSDLAGLKGDQGAGELLNNKVFKVKNPVEKINLLDIDTEEDYQKLFV